MIPPTEDIYGDKVSGARHVTNYSGIWITTVDALIPTSGSMEQTIAEMRRATEGLYNTKVELRTVYEEYEPDPQTWLFVTGKRSSSTIEIDQQVALDKKRKEDTKKRIEIEIDRMEPKS